MFLASPTRSASGEIVQNAKDIHLAYVGFVSFWGGRLFDIIFGSSVIKQVLASECSDFLHHSRCNSGQSSSVVRSMATRSFGESSTSGDPQSEKGNRAFTNEGENSICFQRAEFKLLTRSTGEGFGLNQC